MFFDLPQEPLASQFDSPRALARKVADPSESKAFVAFPLLQLRVLRRRFFKNRDLGIRFMPRLQEVKICGPRRLASSPICIAAPSVWRWVPTPKSYNLGVQSRVKRNGADVRFWLTRQTIHTWLGTMSLHSFHFLA